MEVYKNNSGEILEVSKLPNGRIKLSQVRNAGRWESKSVGTVKELNAFLYNNGYHLAMTERSKRFGRHFTENDLSDELLTIIPNSELAIERNGDIFSCWFLADNADGTIEVSCNAPFAAVNWQGYKAIAVRIDELIIIEGGIE
ncbi:hypothetical protein BK687P3_00014 [Bacteroides phage BK687P3]|nr:hypothetical protein BK687P3_00014 [Bacteroides phage BK687P3]